VTASSEKNVNSSMHAAHVISHILLQLLLHFSSVPSLQSLFHHGLSMKISRGREFLWVGQLPRIPGVEGFNTCLTLMVTMELQQLLTLGLGDSIDSANIVIVVQLSWYDRVYGAIMIENHVFMSCMRINHKPHAFNWPCLPVFQSLCQQIKTQLKSYSHWKAVKALFGNTLASLPKMGTSFKIKRNGKLWSVSCA